MRRMLALVVCAVCSSGPQNTAAQVAVSNTTGQSVLTNSLPVDIFVQLYSPSSRAFATVRVPAGGQAPVSFADPKKLSEEPVALQLPRRNVFRACTVGQSQSAGTDLVQLTKEIKNLDFLKTDSGRARVEAASAQARLDLDQYYDEQNTFRNDPLRSELQRQQNRTLSTQLIQRREQQEALRSVGSDVTQLALSWAYVQRERLSVLHDQFKTFEPLVQQARLALQIREQEFQEYRRTIQAWREFSGVVARSLDVAAPKTTDHPIPTPTVVKVCDGPSGTWDAIQIEGPLRDGYSVLIAEVSFDRGEKQMTHLRRVGDTRQWIGRLDWPEASSTATIRVRWPGTVRWYTTTGKVAVQRSSMEASLKEARQALATIEKNLKDTNFRAAGGDVIKTAPVF